MNDNDPWGCGFLLLATLSLLLSIAFVGVIVWAVIELVTWVTAQ